MNIYYAVYNVFSSAKLTIYIIVPSTFLF